MTRCGIQSASKISPDVRAYGHNPLSKTVAAVRYVDHGAMLLPELKLVSRLEQLTQGETHVRMGEHRRQFVCGMEVKGSQAWVTAASNADKWQLGDEKDAEEFDED